MHSSTALIVRPLTRRRDFPLYDPPDPASDQDATSPDAAEFEAAVGAYKRRVGRPFPTWGEVLEVLRSLGYAKSGT